MLLQIWRTLWKSHEKQDYMLDNQINSENGRKNIFEKVHARVAQVRWSLTEQKSKISSVLTSPPGDVTAVQEQEGQQSLNRERKINFLLESVWAFKVLKL